MRISRATLTRNWLWSTLATVLVGGILGVLDTRLKLLTGAGTADLQDFNTAAQFAVAFHAWGVHGYLARAGFNLGFDYLFMPLYAVAFFYSGILTMETFAPRPGLLRRLLTLAAMAPVVAAGLDAVENAAELALLWNGPTDSLAATAHMVSTAKWIGIAIGFALLLGALLARVQAWQKSRLKGLNPSP
jgi:hypothetical protein